MHCLFVAPSGLKALTSDDVYLTQKAGSESAFLGTDATATWGCGWQAARRVLDRVRRADGATHSFEQLHKMLCDAIDDPSLRRGLPMEADTLFSVALVARRERDVTWCCAGHFGIGVPLASGMHWIKEPLRARSTLTVDPATLSVPLELGTNRLSSPQKVHLSQQESLCLVSSDLAALFSDEEFGSILRGADSLARLRVELRGRPQAGLQLAVLFP